MKLSSRPMPTHTAKPAPWEQEREQQVRLPRGGDRQAAHQVPSQSLIPHGRQQQ